MLNSYSASCGKLCLKSRPPRVPSGSPSTWSSCAIVGRHAVVRANEIGVGADREAADRCARPPGTAPAATARCEARRRCCRSRGSHRRPAAGSVTSMSRSSRSRTALPYSVRFRRWTGLWPGSGERSARSSMVLLDRRREGIQRGGVGSWHALRWHHAAAELHRDLLPELGVGGSLRRVGALERESAGLGAGVVTGDAVLLDECLIGGSGRAGRGRGASACAGRGRLRPDCRRTRDRLAGRSRQPREPRR